MTVSLVKDDDDEAWLWPEMSVRSFCKSTNSKSNLFSNLIGRVTSWNMVILSSDVITVVFPIRVDPVVSDEFVTPEGHSGSADSFCVQCERTEKGDRSALLLRKSVSSP